MEEQEAGPGSPPPKGPSRTKYTPERRRANLQALAAWKGTRKAFCLEHKVSKMTLWQWLNDSKGKKPKDTKTPRKSAKKQTVYTPEQRRRAVEAFSRSGQSLDNFSKAWGVNSQVLGRWARAHRKGGPKALEGRAGRKKGRKPVADGLREGIKQVKAEFPSFGIRKVGAFLARFKGLKASPPQIRRVVEKEGFPRAKPRTSVGATSPLSGALSGPSPASSGRRASPASSCHDTASGCGGRCLHDQRGKSTRTHEKRWGAL